MSSTLLIGEVRVEIFNFWVAHTIGTWAISFAVLEGHALALSNLHEFLVANLHAIDFDAAAMLPSVLHLEVTQP